MNKRDTNIKIYNLLFPIWMIIFLPTRLWLLVIPANYIIDMIVLYLSLKDHPERRIVCRNNTIKVWLAGFASDLIGAAFLFGCMMLGGALGDSTIGNTLEAVSSNPFFNAGTFLVTAIAIAISGAAIFFIDKKILTSFGLDPAQAKKSARWMAIITAPYLYLIPTDLFYQLVRG